MLVINKWNRKKYRVLERTDRNVTLEREDGSRFTIVKSEYHSAYIEPEKTGKE